MKATTPGTDPGSMFRLVTVQHRGADLGHVEVLSMGWAIEDEVLGHLEAMRHSMDRQILAALGEVSPHRFKMTFEYPDGNPYDGTEGIPRHAFEEDSAYILNGPQAGQQTPAYPPHTKTGLRTINGNNVEKYAIIHYRGMDFAVHLATEAPSFFAPQR